MFSLALMESRGIEAVGALIMLMAIILGTSVVYNRSIASFADLH